MTRNVDRHQPSPTPNKEKTVIEEATNLLFMYPSLVRDLKRRSEAGKKRYGTLLQPHNGRDSLMDLYQELLDAVMYSTQYVMEHGEGYLVDSPFVGVLADLTDQVREEIEDRAK